MKKQFKYILMIILVIGFTGCNQKHTWQNNTRMISSVLGECEAKTIQKFNAKPKNYLMDFIGYIQQDLKFRKPSNTKDEFMIKCLKDTVNSNTPTEWYNNTYR